MSVCRVDLIDSVDQFLSAFGFTIRSNRKHHWFSRLVTTLALFDICLSLVGLVPAENADLLTLFSDPGYIALGPKYRHLLNIMYFWFKLHLLVMQCWFTFDNHQWLRDANTEFLKVNSIYISDIKALVKRCQKSSFYMACLVATGATSCAVFYSLFLQRNILKIRYYTFLIYIPSSVFFQSYFSGLYFSQFYFLIKLSIQFTQQYNLNYLKQLSNQGIALRELRQFTHLYMMIQYLKVYLTRSYVTICVCCFGVTTQLYYISFYTDLYAFVRLVTFLVFLALFAFVVYFSTVSDQINSESKMLSTLIYEKFNLKINRLDSIALETEVVEIKNIRNQNA